MGNKSLLQKAKATARVHVQRHPGTSMEDAFGKVTETDLAPPIRPAKKKPAKKNAAKK